MNAGPLTIEVVVWQGGDDVLPQALQRDDLKQTQTPTSIICSRHCKLLLAALNKRRGDKSPIKADDHRSALLTLCGWDLAQFSSLAKTPSLHSMIQCSAMGRDSSLVAAMAMPNPISRTRPPNKQHITWQKWTFTHQTIGTTSNELCRWCYLSLASAGCGGKPSWL